MFPGRPDSPLFGLLPAHPNRLPPDGPGRLGKGEKSSLGGPDPPPGGLSLCSEAQLQAPRSMCCRIAPTISRLHATQRVQRATCPGCCLIAKEEGTQVWFCSLRFLAAARLGWGGRRKWGFLVFGGCCEQDQSEQDRERA